MDQWPIVIYDRNGLIDRARNVEGAVSVLYGDLSTHPGTPRRILCDPEHAAYLRWEAELNADCFGIPVDVVKEYVG